MNIINLEIKKFYSRDNLDRKILVYGKQSNPKNNQLYVTAKDFEIPHGYDYKNAILELRKLDQITLNGKNFLEHFAFSECSLWWFIYQNLIPKYKRKINFIIKFLELIDDFNPATIEIVNDFDNFDIIKQICKNYNIEIKFSKSDFFKFSTKNNIKLRIQKNRYRKITNKKTSLRKKIFENTNKSIPHITDSILFAVPTSYRRNIYNVTNDTSVRGEFLVDNISNLIENQKIVYFDIDYTFNGESDILHERIQDEKDWLPIETILDNEKDSINNFLQYYEKLISDDNFKKLFKFNDISLWSTMESFFEEMTFEPYIPFYVSLISSLETFLTQNKPKAIFLPYETGPIALAFIVVAAKLKIKTFGIQHGYIYEYNPMYSFDNFKDKDNPFGFPLPSHLLLFGKSVKQQLITLGYQESKLIPFGNASFFNLDKIIKNLQKKDLYKKYNIPNNKKIILFATGKLQPIYSNHGVYDYDVQIWKSLLKNFGSNDDIFLILKPHPMEDDIAIYQDLIKKTNSHNSSIINDDLTELLSIATLTVSVFSTVMIDSLCLQKPVIRVIFDNEKHPIFDSCSAILSCDLDSLSKNITNLFKSEDFRNSLVENMIKFVNDNYGIPEKSPGVHLNSLLE